MIKIIDTNLNFIREPLLAPFGFKGGYIDELWQTIACVRSEYNHGVGVGVQSVLWSDAAVFTEMSQSGGNAYMFLITEYALKLIKDTTFSNPIEIFDEIFDKVYAYAKQITSNDKLKKTFVLNALVAVDNAIWQLYAKENNTCDFLKLVPENLRPPLEHRQRQLCNIPLISYNMNIQQILNLVNEGFFILKIKIGSDPDADGSQEKMLAWDKNRIFEIHNAAKDIKTPHTKSGQILYYLDANGRYKKKSTLIDFLEYADSIGALERIIILEEPFPEENRIDVSDLPVRIAADESIHSIEEAVERIQLGYGTIALKAIAKTMSFTIKVLNEAYRRNIPCFCADLTVNPLLVQFNKNIAARISPLPGINMGVLESNGAQNYKNWAKMKAFTPAFIEAKNGIFQLDEEFYKISGGIFNTVEYYESLVI